LEPSVTLAGLKIKITIALFVVTLTNACGRPAGNTSGRTSPSSPSSIAESRAISSTDVVKASPDEVTILRGGTVDALVRLKIDSGYHVNANPPSFPYLKPTELELTPEGGLSVSFTKYPDPLMKNFSFSESPLAVYEGETTLSVRLKADKSIALGRKNLSGKLRVQACDDQVCYAPASMDIVIPVNVQ
jgi:DsbC/DsbD-like thiol-disulfide interchange protein